jgi:hypothetical protein
MDCLFPRVYRASKEITKYSVVRLSQAESIERSSTGVGAMSMLKAYLFGKFCIRSGDHFWQGPEGCKAKELLCYLLIHRAAPQNREHLASVLWSDNTTSQSKKYLRQVLWQLHSACEAALGEAHGCLLLINPDSIQLNPEIELWTDVASFEQAFGRLRGETELNKECANALQSATELYHSAVSNNFSSSLQICSGLCNKKSKSSNDSPLRLQIGTKLVAYRERRRPGAP